MKIALLSKRLGKWAGWISLIYVVSSGPLAGLISHLPWKEESAFKSALLLHMVFYYPLMVVTGWFGGTSLLFDYWYLCGWICPIAFPA